VQVVDNPSTDRQGHAWPSLTKSCHYQRH